jgi:hypothetical protein
VKSSVLAVAVAAKVYAATATIRGSKRSGGRTIVGCAHCGRARDRSAAARRGGAARAAPRAARARALHTSTIRYYCIVRAAPLGGPARRHAEAPTYMYAVLQYFFFMS